MLFLVLLLGLAASITAIYRVTQRSGVGLDSPIEVSRLSEEQRANMREKFLQTLFDPEQRLDLFLLAFGFISSITAFITLYILVYTYSK